MSQLKVYVKGKPGVKSVDLESPVTQETTGPVTMTIWTNTDSKIAVRKSVNRDTKPDAALVV